MENEALTVGLCATCLHCRTVQTSRSVFYLCTRSLVDDRYRKYPALPVLQCRGYEETSQKGRDKPDEEAP